MLEGLPIRTVAYKTFPLAACRTQVPIFVRVDDGNTRGDDGGFMVAVHDSAMLFERAPLPNGMDLICHQRSKRQIGLHLRLSNKHRGTAAGKACSQHTPR
jgi:hypothetical protein